MGLFAFLAILITARVLWTVLVGDGLEAEREARRRDPTSSGPQMDEASARMGSALKDLNTSFPLLGGQAGFQLPPPPEGVPIDDVDERYTESVSGWGEEPDHD